MGDDPSCVAERTHRAHRPRPTKLVLQKLLCAPLGACVTHEERRYRDTSSGSAYGLTYRIVIGKRRKKCFESTNRGKHFAAKRNRRAETRPRETQCQPHQDTRHKMVVDRHTGEP